MSLEYSGSKWCKDDPYLESAATPRKKASSVMTNDQIINRAKSAAAKMQFLSFQSDKNDRDRLKKYYQQVFAVSKRDNPIIARRLRYKAIDKLARKLLKRAGTNSWRVKSSPAIDSFVVDELWNIRGFPTALRDYQSQYNAKLSKTSRSRMSENHLYNYFSGLKSQ